MSGKAPHEDPGFVRTPLEPVIMPESSSAEKWADVGRYALSCIAGITVPYVVYEAFTDLNFFASPMDRLVLLGCVVLGSMACQILWIFIYDRKWKRRRKAALRDAYEPQRLAAENWLWHIRGAEHQDDPEDHEVFPVQDLVIDIMRDHHLPQVRIPIYFIEWVGCIEGQEPTLQFMNVRYTDGAELVFDGPVRITAPNSGVLPPLNEAYWRPTAAPADTSGDRKEFA